MVLAVIEVTLRTLRERHPSLQWTQHVGTHGNSYAYRGSRPGYAVTLIPYVQDCREGELRGGVYGVLREAPRHLWLQQSNTGDPQSLYTGVLHGEAHMLGTPPAPAEPDGWVLLGA